MKSGHWLNASAALACACAPFIASAAPVTTKAFADFSANPYSFTVDDSTFTFSGTGDIFNPTAVSTSGGAEVNSFGGFFIFPLQPTSDFINRGTVTFGPGMQFSSFPTAATIPYSNSYNFIGLLAMVNGQSYYGYAFTTDNTLNTYAFESTPNTAITASADVPEPTSWALMVGGFGMIGGAMRTRRRTSVKHA